MPTLLSDLNPEQLKAVTLPNESALIIAGAGSGKTRVLTTRIAYLINEKHVNPASIMAVTFTNKAAREMLDRLSGMLPVHIDIKNMWIGTFHSICNRFLRIHSKDANLSSSFQILDSSEQLSLIKRLLKMSKAEETKEENLAKKLQYFIKSSKEEGLRANAIDPRDVEDKRLIELYTFYEKQCSREGVVDFAELLLRCFELLNGHSVVSRSLSAHYRQRFSNIFVDEFQDTNRLQYAWLKSFVGDDNSIFAVGDDDQSIYAFRGANVGNMFDFEREFSIKHLIKLETNYRSHAHILNAANSLIANNSHRFGKNLSTDHVFGEPLRVFEALSDREEARWIAEEIKDLNQSKKIGSKDIAILYRSNAQSRTIEQALAAGGISYRVYGGMRFFERQEIKHLLAYLRLLGNIRDDNAFLRVVNFPARGIGPLTLTRLVELSRSYGCSISEAIPYVTGKSRNSLMQFLYLIDKFRLESAAFNLPDAINYLISATGLKAFYEKEPDGQDRIENLSELVNAALAFIREFGIDNDMPAIKTFDYDQSSPSSLSNMDWPARFSSNQVGGSDINQDIHETTILSNFLSYASLEAGDNQASLGDAVQLMTVHAAKGLEYRTVFITGLEEGLFPHDNSKSELDSVEEERRLMYVAITRAREYLYLSFAQSRMLHGKTRYHRKSRFLDELPDSTLKWILPPSSHAMGKNFRNISQLRPHREFDFRVDLKNVGFDSSNPLSTNFADDMSCGDKKYTLKSKEFNNYQLGQVVKHAKFGEGTIVQFEGQGKDKRARVHFYNNSNKWLLLEVAKLEIFESRG